MGAQTVPQTVVPQNAEGHLFREIIKKIMRERSLNPNLLYMDTCYEVVDDLEGLPEGFRRGIKSKLLTRIPRDTPLGIYRGVLILPNDVKQWRKNCNNGYVFQYSKNHPAYDAKTLADANIPGIHFCNDAENREIYKVSNNAYFKNFALKPHEQTKLNMNVATHFVLLMSGEKGVEPEAEICADYGDFY